jgi:DNA-damage-inducible protein J
MSKTATVRARMEPHLKREAEHLLEELGLSATEAITLFYRQVTLRKGLPFDVVIPNATTRKTFESTDRGRDLMVCKDADDMFRKLRVQTSVGSRQSPFHQATQKCPHARRPKS